jgi:excisionase family DNA binding protein
METQQPSTDHLLDKWQVLERLKMSLRTLDNHIKAGTIPYVKLGKFVRFIPSDIDKFIKSHKIGG